MTAPAENTALDAPPEAAAQPATPAPLALAPALRVVTPREYLLAQALHPDSAVWVLFPIVAAIAIGQVINWMRFDVIYLLAAVLAVAVLLQLGRDRSALVARKRARRRG